MAFLVVLTFDLDTMSQDKYDGLSEGLSAIGLKKELVGDSGNSTLLPSNTYSGKFIGAGAAKIRDDIIGQIGKVFSDNQAHGRLFLAVGGNSWAWITQNL